MDLVNEVAPVGDGVVGVKGNAVADAGMVFTKDGFIISRDFLRFQEVFFQMGVKLPSLIDMFGDRELVHLAGVALEQGLMEDQFVDQGIAGILRSYP